MSHLRRENTVDKMFESSTASKSKRYRKQDIHRQSSRNSRRSCTCPRLVYIVCHTTSVIKRGRIFSFRPHDLRKGFDQRLPVVLLRFLRELLQYLLVKEHNELPPDDGMVTFRSDRLYWKQKSVRCQLIICLCHEPWNVCPWSRRCNQLSRITNLSELCKGLRIL